MREAI